MTEQESIRIITEMIETARSRVRRGEGNIAMFWGAVVMIASLAHFALHQAGYPAEAPYVWLLIFAGVAYSIWFSATQQAQDRTKTHIDRILDHLWLGFGICMIVLGFLSAEMGNLSFSVIELFYGLSLFVSGAAFRFRPLIIGGIGCWVAAVIMPFLEYPYHLLILALSVLGYIIPGWLLNRKAHV
jgi:hypothetical protein